MPKHAKMIDMHKRTLGFVLCLSVLLTGCDQPKRVALERRPVTYANAISLSPSTTEISSMAMLNLAGRTKACDYPASSVSNKPIVADLKPDYEAIAKTGSKLILVDGDLYNPEEKAKMAATGCKVLEFKAKTVEEFERELFVLGNVVGNETNIATYVDRIRKARRIAAGDAPSQKPKAVLILPGEGGQHLIAGVKSFQADLMKIIGTEPVGPDSERFEVLSPEFLIQANPDVIVVAGPTAKFLADTRYSSLTAVKNLSMFGGDEVLWVRRGSRVDQLIEKAHKSLMLVLKNKK